MIPDSAKDNRKTQALFECIDCGYTGNADVVGAINVLKRGQQHEPTEVS